MADHRETRIAVYFQRGYSYKEILAFLYGKDNIRLSLRQLKRVLAKLGLFRRKSNCSFANLCDVIQKEVQNSGSLLGYRNMHQKLKVVHNIQTSRNTVSKIQQLVDPEGVELRKARKLKRRKYIAKGPNYLWHLDGYDKLKRFGFCIHGCIDGFSRKLLWLEVSETNNCPKAIANYFIQYVSNINGTARIIRGDRGNENLNVAAIQRFYRTGGTDSMADQNSFLFGRSTANQRIEAFWNQLRRTNAQWWMNYFKDMADDGSWDDTDVMQRQCLKFCFCSVIQEELNVIRLTHNTHTIRPYPNQECPSGKPDIIYSLPECFGSADYKIDVPQSDIEITTPYVATKSNFGCSKEFEKLALYFMAQEDLLFPRTAVDSRRLYDHLLELIDNI